MDTHRDRPATFLPRKYHWPAHLPPAQRMAFSNALDQRGGADPRFWLGFVFLFAVFFASLPLNRLEPYLGQPGTLMAFVAVNALAWVIVWKWWWPRIWNAHAREVLEAFGLCTNCGYDVRGVKGSCPECGVPVRRQNADPPAAKTNDD